MLDIRYLRNNFDRAVRGMARRNNPALDLTPFLEMDARFRALQAEVDELKAQRNAGSKDKNADRELMKELSTKIKECALTRQLIPAGQTNVGALAH